MAFKMVRSLRIQAMMATFLALPLAKQALVIGLDYRVEAGGHQGSHVEGLAQPAAAALDMTLASPLAAVPVKGSHPRQGGDLFAVQAP